MSPRVRPSSTPLLYVHRHCPANRDLTSNGLTTLQGRRAVLTHNSHLRLATIRHAMIEPLKRPPAGFRTAGKS
jgi:hypothetical protein